jgi:S-formylglutathione hydrolase
MPSGNRSWVIRWVVTAPSSADCDEAQRYRSVSAFAPIGAPSQVPWGQKAFSGYLGAGRDAWLQYDATALVARHRRRDVILIDQGTSDKFLDEQLRPQLFAEACRRAGQELRLRNASGYDHGYYFIQTYVGEHIAFHAAALNAS